jgi:phage terminase large subunit
MASITDAEIIELEELTKVQDNFDFLKTPTKSTNPNYKFLHKAINEQEWGFDDNDKPKLIAGYAGCILEGSSRSGKTWSGIDIIIWLCAIVHEKEGCTINIYRETYNEFKDTLYDDFKRRLDDYGLPNKFKYAQEIKSFKIGNSKISFLGDGKHGGGCDYAFFNEAMTINKAVFDQVKMRCRKFWWMDYNPSFTHHWVFTNVANRKDVGFLRTTYEDNPFIAPGELNEILVSEPWETGSYYVSEDGVLMYQGKEIDEGHAPPPHKENVESGTADEDYWKIYGLGLRGAMEGVIFKTIKYIKEWPAHLPFAYGLDFGFTSDETALVRYAKEGRNIYLELLLYSCYDNSEDLDTVLHALNISQHDPITADSSDRYVASGRNAVYMVRELFEYDWEIAKVSKTKRIVFWIGSMKKNRIHVVINDLSDKFKTEQQNYKWKKINGITIPQPIDGFDHAISAARYAHMAHEQENN